MAVYNVKVDLYIDGSTNNDAWAQGLVENVVDYTKALGGQASVVVGTAGERNSYATSGVIEADQTLTVEKAWHVNDIGLVVDGLPDGSGGPPPATAWAAGVTYAIDDTVIGHPGTREFAKGREKIHRRRHLGTLAIRGDLSGRTHDTGHAQPTLPRARLCPPQR